VQKSAEAIMNLVYFSHPFHVYEDIEPASTVNNESLDLDLIISDMDQQCSLGPALVNTPALQVSRKKDMGIGM
jgi:hypothetical protein